MKIYDTSSVPRTGDNYQDATRTLVALCGMVAKQFNVCPICLMYNAAGTIEDAEQAGVVHHTNDHSDDLEEALRDAVPYGPQQ